MMWLQRFLPAPAPPPPPLPQQHSVLEVSEPFVRAGLHFALVQSPPTRELFLVLLDRAACAAAFALEMRCGAQLLRTTVRFSNSRPFAHFRGITFPISAADVVLTSADAAPARDIECYAPCVRLVHQCDIKGASIYADKIGVRVINADSALFGDLIDGALDGYVGFPLLQRVFGPLPRDERVARIARCGLAVNVYLLPQVDDPLFFVEETDNLYFGAVSQSTIENELAQHYDVHLKEAVYNPKRRYEIGTVVYGKLKDRKHR